jgi:ribosomal protein S18 acetylase RimI-like enzyme
MDIELRAARPQDAAAIAALFGAARDAALPFLAVLHSANEDRAYFAGLAAAGGTSVALQDARVVGFLVLGDARVEHLCVDPSHWRRGIGSALLRHAQLARPGGLDLWVFGRNTAAIAFYEHHGFRIAERTDGAGNAEREPDARMVWPGA